MQSKYLKKPLKWLLYLILFLLTAFVIAYISAPYWVPSQIQQFLPQQLQLKSLQLERPGLRSARVKQLEFDISGETNARVLLKNVIINYSIFEQKLTAIDAERTQLSISNSGNSSSKVFSNKISISAIPVNKVTIGQLTLSGLFVQDLDFNKLQLTTNNKQLTATSQLSFLGLTFNLNVALETLNSFVSKITSNIQQNDDEVALSLIPDPDDESAFSWTLDSKLDINNYFPIESLALIEVAGSGSYQHSELMQLSFDKGFALAAPIKTDSFDLDSIVAAITTEKGIKFDSSNIADTIQFLWSNQESFEFSFDPASYQIDLSQGSFDLTTQHPMLHNQITIEKLSLNPNLALSAPEQSIKGRLKTRLQLSELSIQQKDTHLGSNSVSVELTTPFTIDNSNLSLASKQLAVSLGQSSFANQALKTIIKPTLWHGKATVKQNLVGNDSENSLNIELQQKQPIGLELTTKADQISLSNLRNTLQLNNRSLNIYSKASQAKTRQQDISIKNINARTKLNLDQLKPSGSIRFSDSSFANEQLVIDPFSGTSHWSLSKDIFKANGHLNYANEKIPFSYAINTKKDSHNITISPLNLSSDTIGQWLAPQLEQYPALAINQGSVSSPSIKGDPLALLFNGNATLKNLHFSYEKMQLFNLSIQATLTGKTPLSGVSQGSIERIEVASGIDITDLTFSLVHTIDQFNFSQIKGQLLAGTIEIPTLSIAPDEIQPFNVQLNDIDLGKLLQSLDSESLAIEGSFTFDLPIRIQSSSQTITNGVFYSEQPGVLSVNSGTNSGSASETNIAFQALQNFHYEEFSGTIDYSNQGIYILDIFLKGSNPDLYDGFPIELKMKIEGNLPNLLYSMLISGDMAKPIIDKYQSGELNLPTTESQP